MKHHFITIFVCSRRSKMKLTFSALSVAVSSKRRVTSTYFPMVLSRTCCTNSARTSQTESLTFSCLGKGLSPVTFFIKRTIRVSSTSNFDTEIFRVSLQPVGTETESLVWFHSTFSVSTTNFVQTWVDTFVWDTSLWEWTIPVYLTFV